MSQLVFPTMVHQASPGKTSVRRPAVDHGRENKRAEFEASKPRHSGHRLNILQLLQQEPAGLTRHQIAQRLDMPLATVCGRVNELKRMGEVTEPGERRPTGKGKSTATVVRYAAA